MVETDVEQLKKGGQPMLILVSLGDMGVSKKRGKKPKMDGENNGKPY